MLQKVLTGMAQGCLIVISHLIFTPVLEAQTSVCRVPSGNVSLQAQIKPFNGGTINLGQFSGTQVLIMAARGSMNRSRDAARLIDLEFQNNQKFRQIILLDGRAMSAFRGMITEEMKKKPPETSKKTIFSVDFDGNNINPLINTSEKLFSNVDLNESSILFILDGKGKVLGAYNQIEGADLSIRQCLRQQLK